MTAPEDIIWLQTAFIGDVVLSSGAIELAASSFPKSRQHLISTAIGCEVLKGSPSLKTRISFSKKEAVWSSFPAVKKKLKEAGINFNKAVVLQVHRSMRSSLLCKYLGIKTITYDETVGGFLAGERVRRDRSEHEVVRVASLLEALGVSWERIKSVKPKLQPLALDDSVPWQMGLLDSNFKQVALAVGSQWGTKRWPLEHYQELTKKLLQNENLVIWLLGSLSEKELTDSIENKNPSKRIWNLAGKTSFDDLRRLFPKLDLLISNDSSPIHFASSFNIPILAIFGPTIPSFGFGPLSEISAVVEHKNLSCRPCSDHGPQVCPLKHFRCMRELTPESVYAVAQELLRR